MLHRTHTPNPSGGLKGDKARDKVIGWSGQIDKKGMITIASLQPWTKFQPTPPNTHTCARVRWFIASTGATQAATSKESPGGLVITQLPRQGPITVKEKLADEKESVDLGFGHHTKHAAGHHGTSHRQRR